MATPIFLDTEFMSNTMDLISIALVHGQRRLYLVSNEFDESKADVFVKQHVLPQLPPEEERVSKKEIAQRIEDFLYPFRYDRLEFWCWYGAWDWTMLTSLWGGFDKNPWWLPIKYHEYSDKCEEYGWKWNPHKFTPDDYEGKEHDCLYDALILQKAFVSLERKIG
jgi:hypothetical protein